MHTMVAGDRVDPMVNLEFSKGFGTLENGTSTRYQIGRDHPVA